MLPVMMGALGANTHTHYHAALLALQCAVGGIGVGPGAIAGSARSSALRFSVRRVVFSWAVADWLCDLAMPGDSCAVRERCCAGEQRGTLG